MKRNKRSFDKNGSMQFIVRSKAEAGISYDNSVSLQTDDAGHVGAAVLAHVTYVVGLQTNVVRRNWKGLKVCSGRDLPY